MLEPAKNKSKKNHVALKAPAKPAALSSSIKKNVVSLSGTKGAAKPHPSVHLGYHAPAVADLFLQVVPEAMKELRRQGRGFANSSLTIPQFRILAHLGCELAATNKNLAESIGVSVAATSRMVDLLVKRGLVERLQGTRDRREIELRLSPKGLQEFEGVRLFVRKGLASRLEHVPESDLLKAVEGLRALQEILALLHRGQQ